MPLTTEDARRRAYYRSALMLLRFVEARSPTSRRFGPEADALWRSFAGDLDTSDRLELLLRDADRQWGGAFGARAVFALRSAHEQDAFGADWRRLSSTQAAELWKQALADKPVSDPGAAILAILREWQLEPKPFELPKLGPSSRVVIVGLAAITAATRAFLANPDLSWPNQVAIVADEPGPRQLAAATAALGDHAEPTLLLHSEQLDREQLDRVRSKLGGTLQVIASPDATPQQRDAASRLATRKAA
ncbi:MAG TPA: hypothetical protein VM869_21930 [Enhygromyxa sp.]|nr:hypothetical protein [Enhygromyxa sp.]